MGAVCRLTPEIARSDLAQLDLRAPFAGVPLLMKDLGAPLGGIPTVAGSRYFARHPVVAPADNELVRRFRAAGFLIVGKTTVPEFGLSLATEPMLGPVCRNPWDGSRTAGGSSGGSAAAVAAGLVPIAHATDAGGSIRVPAACCGLVGLKPSRGAIPQGPDFGNLLMGLASELVVARSVRDVALAFDIAAGDGQGPYASPIYPTSAFSVLEQPPASMRVGVVTESSTADPIGLEQRQAVRDAAALLEAEGHRIDLLDAAELAEIQRLSSLAFQHIVCANLAAFVPRLSPQPVADDLEPMTWAALERGMRLPASALIEADLAMAEVAHRFARLFTRIDALVLPMLAHAPPPIGSFPTNGGDLDAHFARMAAFSPYAAPANAGGIPAIAVPHGIDRQGLPLSVQMLGPMGADTTLLQLARALERRAPWPFLSGIA